MTSPTGQTKQQASKEERVKENVRAVLSGNRRIYIFSLATAGSVAALTLLAGEVELGIVIGLLFLILAIGWRWVPDE